MELLAIALVLIFVLHLIDKHNRWRQALKLTVGLVVLGVIGIGGLYGWQKYQDYRQEKQEQQEVAARGTAVSACVSRLEEIYKARPPLKNTVLLKLPDFEGACLADPLTTDVPPDTIDFIGGAPFAKPKSASPGANLGWAVVTAYSSIVKRCAFDVGLSPCGYSDTSNGEIAQLNKSDRVQLLSDKVRAPDGTEIYQVKFQQWTGWVDASNLTLEKAE